MADVFDGVSGALVAQVARWFHEAYEQLAPSHGYETRKASAVPWEDVPVQNKKLMMDTVAVVLSRLRDEGYLGGWRAAGDEIDPWVQDELDRMD